MNKHKVSIKTIPDVSELKTLIADAQACIEYHNTGGQVTYDHLENSIAVILGLKKPNPELDELED